MAELAEEGDLAEGGGGDALVLDLEADALEGDDLVGGLVAGLVMWGDLCGEWGGGRGVS